MQSVKIGSNQAGQRLDKFLRKCLPGAGQGFLYKMLRKKNITLNGKKAEGPEMLSEGDEVKFFFSEETFAKFSQMQKPGTGNNASAGKTSNAMLAEYNKAYNQLQGIEILYEDVHVLAVNKPAGVLTQKAAPQDISLNEWLIGYLLSKNPALAQELGTFRPSVCNRLDRNTSGIVLCGKSLAGLQYLSRCIKERSIQKYYQTICCGELTQAGLLKGYLTKNETENKVAVSKTASKKMTASAAGMPKDAKAQGKQAGKETGDYIETRYEPLCCENGYTLLEVELITGKTHQIRAHLASIGHPLIGDGKYGNEKNNRQFRERFQLKHQLLHAARVVFPVTEEAAGAALSGKTITAPCPKQFEEIRAKLQLEKSLV